MNIETIAIPIITLLGGWLLGSRKNKAEAQKTEVDSVSTAVKIWRELAQDLKNEVEELRAVVEELRVENKKLQIEVEQLKKQKHEA